MFRITPKLLLIHFHYLLVTCFYQCFCQVLLLIYKDYTYFVLSVSVCLAIDSVFLIYSLFIIIKFCALTFEFHEGINKSCQNFN